MKKQNLFILITLLTTSLTATAYGAPQGFKCIPTMRDTRLQVLEKEKTIEVTVVNPSGYEFMPQFSGPSSTFDMAFHKMQSQDLAALKESFTFAWDKSKCKLSVQNFNLDCQGPALEKKENIGALGLTTTEITEKYKTETYDKRRFRFSVEKENFYFINLEFYTKSCINL